MSRLGRNASIGAGRDMDGPINPTPPGNQYFPRKADPTIAVELAGGRPRLPPSQMGRRRATWSSARDARANSRAADASEALRYEPRYCVRRGCLFFFIPKQHIIFDGTPQPMTYPTIRLHPLCALLLEGTTQSVEFTRLRYFATISKKICFVPYCCTTIAQGLRFHFYFEKK